MNISATSPAMTPLAAAKIALPQTQSQRELLQAARVANEAQLFGQENEVTFVINRAAGVAVVRIVNRETGEVVQQIPTEHLLKMAEESNER